MVHSLSLTHAPSWNHILRSTHTRQKRKCLLILTDVYFKTLSAPGIPELELYRATADSVSFSWTMPSGSVVDSFEIKYEINHTRHATFVDILPPTAFNYTVTGLRDFDRSAIYSITVIAQNGAGRTSSAKLKFVADFASGGGGTMGGNESDSEGSDGGLIAGVVIAGVIVLVLTIVIVIVLVCKTHKTKTKKEDRSETPLYS